VRVDGRRREARGGEEKKSKEEDPIDCISTAIPYFAVTFDK
jgi:hypothetical protein